MHITHCPECTTAFKVSAEQLALASGWVRCGRCGAVFEAQKHGAPASKTEMSAEVASPAVGHEPFVHTEPPQDLSHALRAQTLPADAPRMGIWAVLCGVLLLLWGWQILLFHRHVLAAQEPSLKPVLQVLCAPLACDVTWPLESDSVQIENSSFNEAPQGGYTLQLRMKNTQHHPVATPYLELNLTDLQDQVVVRRVFSTQEMGLKEHIASLRDVRVNLHFELDPKISEQVSGFRALIFYP